MWLGILGAPAAWTAQHVFGFGVTQAGCSPANLSVPIDTWTLIATIVAAVLAIAGLAAALLTYRAMRGTGQDDPPPEGRIYFLSICGIVISPLFLAIILMSGIATLLLTNCHQG
jgi:heme/copper-type cytochrome/quinol oxidase subunit 2